MKADGAPDKLQKLIELPAHAGNPSAQEAWRVFGIMSEFVAASEKLNRIRPGVTTFGSARVPPGHSYYTKTERIGRLLSDAGFSVISGGGPASAEGMIGPEDLALRRVIDEPEAVVDAIFQFYETRGFGPTRAQREMLLNL